MWHAVEIDGVAVAGPVFSYEDTNDGAIVSGTGSCNRYSGRALVNGNKIELSQFITTLMACDGKMEIEVSFYAALRNVRSFSVTDGLLELKSEYGRSS